MKKTRIISAISLILALIFCFSSCEIWDVIKNEFDKLHEHSWENWVYSYGETDIYVTCTVCGENVIAYPVSEGLVIEDGVLTGVGTCTDEYVVIPYGVTAIGDSAFKDCASAKGVLMPNTVETIGASAFENCTSLYVINLPNGIKSIGERAFYGCSALVGVFLPSEIEIIGDRAFGGCEKLHDFYFDGDEEAWDKVDKHDDWNKDSNHHDMHHGSHGHGGDGHHGDRDNHGGKHEGDEPGGDSNKSNLLLLKLNEDKQSYTVAGLAKIIDVPGIAYEYDTSQISDTIRISNIETIEIPDFYKGLPITRIGEWAFSSNEAIKRVIFGENSQVKIIEKYAFSYMKSLTDIVIPSTVTSIGECAFDGCDLLKEIYIPDLVEHIGILALAHCDSLEKIDVSENNTHYTSIDGNLYTKDAQTLIQYAIGKGDELFNIPDSVVTIGNDSVSGAQSLKCVNIPDSVITIGEHSFAACKKLKSVVIPDSVTELGYQAFFCCSELSSVVLSESLYGIPDDAFLSCHRLSSITIPKSIQGIGERAFYKCYSLVEIINQSHINITAGSKHNGYIGYYALHITNDASQSYLQNINDYIFYDDGMDVHLITYIGDSTELVLPAYHEDKSYDIYDYAFFLNEDIQSVIIPEGVTKIGEAGFYWCHGLKKVVLPNSLTYIGKSAFCEAHLLESINLPLHLEYIGDGAFTWNFALKSIVIPRSVTHIGSEAFYGATSLTIYCERSSKPGGWESNWNTQPCDVVWGYTGE